MTQSILSVEGLGKKYLIGQKPSSHGRFKYASLRDSIADALLSPVQKLRAARRGAGRAKSDSDLSEFWALKNVSFEVQPGEVVGIVGRNGAGKSTLLKVLSRITEPTSGLARLRGRLASLLEVGTGFHPELTGRENIFLNGAILGLSRFEIKRKFDEIVSFADVEQFLDTPVKRYSSGMYVRLAFAVASTLEPEILVVDEVLAVGDADFQKKCMGKMQDVGRDGRTVLLVSHNMGSIASLCKRAICLDRGQVIADGLSGDVIFEYLRGPGVKVDFSAGRPIGDDKAILLSAHAENLKGELLTSFKLDEAFRVVMKYRILQDLQQPPYPNFHFLDERGQYAFVTSDRSRESNRRGDYTASCTVPPSFLNDGAYFIGVALTSTNNGLATHFWEKDALSIHMIEEIGDPFEGPRFGYVGPIPGSVRPKLSWQIERD